MSVPEPLLVVRILWIALLAFLGAPLRADASLVLQYTGTPYTVATAPYDTTMHLSATITLVAPLASNLSDMNERDNVASFSISLGAGPAFALSNFFLSTDASGAITDWYMTGAVDPGALTNTNFASCGPASFATRCQSPTPGYDIVWHFQSGPEPVITVLATSSAAGAWVPEPSLATLAALALCGVGVATRRLATSR